MLIFENKVIGNMKKKAMITGITGQDGSYLAEYLLMKGYEVHGIIRKASTFNTHRIEHIYVDSHMPNAKLFLHYNDLADAGPLSNLIHKIQPDEIYNLGAQSHVRVSFDMPEYTCNIDALGTVRILEAIRKSNFKTKFYQASSSEMFGDSPPPQNENSPFKPRSPYACAKELSYWMARNYREGYGLFICNGILFNHESPRRGETFVTKKITRAVANIIQGKQKNLYLGNLNAKRDWGYAPEYVEAMWLILQQEECDDYVIGTGESHSVKEFVEQTFDYVGIEIEWKGEGIAEKGVIKNINNDSHDINPKLQIGDCIISIESRYFRPTEVEILQADITKAKQNFNWQPRIKFKQIVKIMMDYELLQTNQEAIGDGIEISKTNGYHWTNHEYSLQERIKKES